MSLKISKMVWESDLKPNLKLVALALADFANDDGECWPSVPTVARLCGVEPRSIRRSVGELMALGILDKRPRFDNNRQRSNLWRFAGGDAGVRDDVRVRGEGDMGVREGMTSTSGEGGRQRHPEPSYDPSLEPPEGTDDFLALPTFEEFEKVIDENQLIHIRRMSIQVFADLCEDGWHQTDDETGDWVPIKNWVVFLKKLEERLSQGD